MNYNEVISLYNENVCNTRDICVKFGISFAKLFSILKENNIPKRKHRVFNRKPCSESQKLKISETMKKIHSEGKHSGWTAVNSKKEDSYPERVLFKYLSASDELSKYEILPKYPVGRYVLDFVIVELKLNIELDGQYHFNDANTIEKDIRRDDFMKSNGWKVYRISWTYFNKNREVVIRELIDFINSDEVSNRSYTKSDYSVDSLTCRCGNHKFRTSKVCRQCNNSHGHTTKRKFEISKEELESLVNMIPMISIGKMFGVSDNAVKKRCRKLGIELKDMRGYWRKMQTGKI